MHFLFTFSQDLVQAWDYAFFTPQPVLTLSVFRFLTGLLILSETYSWLGVYKNLLSPTGWFSFEDFEKHHAPLRFSLLTYLPTSDTSIRLLLFVQAIAALCLTLGVGAQVAAGVCFLTLVSLHNRNLFALNSCDTVHRYFCLFLLFAPSGQQLSVQYPGELLRPGAIAWPWPLSMIRFFVANIYLKNVFFKLLGEGWRRGTATQKVLNVRIWNRRPLPTRLNHPWFFKLTSYGTLAIETALFSLIWIQEFRLPLVGAGILFHVGLWYFLRLGFFQITMIVGLLSFVEPHEYLSFFRWIGL